MLALNGGVVTRGTLLMSLLLVRLTPRRGRKPDRPDGAGGRSSMTASWPSGRAVIVSLTPS